MTIFKVGDWVEVNQQHYSHTQMGSYGRLPNQPSMRPNSESLEVTFCRITSIRPEDNQLRDGYRFPIRIDRLRLLESITPAHISYWTALLVSTRTTDEGHFRGYVGLTLWETGLTRHSGETIKEVIQRLHYSQAFFRENQDRLEYWNASRPT